MTHNKKISTIFFVTTTSTFTLFQLSIMKWQVTRYCCDKWYIMSIPGCQFQETNPGIKTMITIYCYHKFVQAKC